MKPKEKESRKFPSVDGYSVMEQTVYRGDMGFYHPSARVKLNQGMCLSLDTEAYFTKEEVAWEVAALLAGVLNMQLEAIHLPPRHAEGYAIKKYEGQLPQWVGTDTQYPDRVHALDNGGDAYCGRNPELITKHQGGSLVTQVKDITCHVCLVHFGLSLYRGFNG